MNWGQIQSQNDIITSSSLNKIKVKGVVKVMR